MLWNALKQVHALMLKQQIFAQYFAINTRNPQTVYRSVSVHVSKPRLDRYVISYLN